MPWIWNHKHKIEEKSRKSTWSSPKVVGLERAEMWEFPTLHNPHIKLLEYLLDYILTWSAVNIAMNKIDI